MVSGEEKRYEVLARSMMTSGFGAVDIDRMRAETKSFLREHEALLLERNSMRFELETAKSSSLREESRLSLLEKENNHLKEQLHSNLAVLQRGMSGIVDHFNATDTLAETKEEIERLNRSLLERLKINAVLEAEIERFKREREAMRLEHAAKSARQEKNLDDLKRRFTLAMKREEDRGKAEVDGAKRAVADLRAEMGQEANRRGAEVRSVEIAWKEKVLALQREAKTLREENERLRSKAREAEAPRSRSGKAKRTKLRR